MRVLVVTGATGLINTAVLAPLVVARQHVVDLARSDASAAALGAIATAVHQASPNDVYGRLIDAANTDGVIHPAFIHPFADVGSSVTADHRGITTRFTTLRGVGRCA